MSVTTGDALIRLALSGQILKHGKLYIPADRRVGQMLPGDSTDPRRFSYFGLGKTLWNLPFMVLSQAVNHIEPAFGNNITFLVSFSNAPLAALMAVVLFLLLLDFGFSRRTAFLTVVVYGFATVTFAHAKYNVSETLAALTLLLTVFHTFRFARVRRPRDALLAGIYLGISIHTRATAMVVIPLVLVYGFLRARSGPPEHRRAWLRGALYFLGAVLVFVALQLAYNVYRYGSPWEFGYSLKGDRFIWSPLFILRNTVALLVSPRVGLFVYMPVLLFGIAGLRPLYRRYRWETVFLGALFGIYLLIHAAWWYWFAFYAGPRFLAQVHWTLMPFVAYVLERWGSLRPKVHALFWVAVLWGVGINLVFLWASPRRARYIEGVQALIQKIQVSPVPTPEEVWNPLRSPVVEQLTMIWDMKTKQKVRIIPQVWIQKYFNTPNFWWLHYTRVLPLWKVWLAVILLMALALWSWSRLVQALLVPIPRSP